MTEEEMNILAEKIAEKMIEKIGQPEGFVEESRNVKISGELIENTDDRN